MSILSKQAVDWFLRMRSAHCTLDDRAAFHAWLSADPEHQKEFTAVSSMWGAMDKVLATPFPELDACLALPPRRRISDYLRRAGRIVTWSPLQSWAPGLVVLLVVAGSWWLWQTFHVHTTIYETAVGEQKTIVLEDGSQLELNTGTRITAGFSSRTRSIELQQGEAAFTVVHEATRPFEVTAGGRHILDIGTQFDVRQSEGHVDVVVTQGSVLISNEPTHANSAAKGILLTAGHRVRYALNGPEEPVIALNPDESHRLGAWRNGKLIFSGMRLAEAIQEVNRYWSGQIIVDAPALADIKVQGTFNVHQLDQFFTSLPRIVPIEISRPSPHQVRITARQSSGPQ